MTEGRAIVLFVLITITSIAAVQLVADLQIPSLPTIANLPAKIWDYSTTSNVRKLPIDIVRIAADNENPSINNVNQTVELTFSKEYPSSPWPVEQQYVRYDLHLRYLGTGDLKNQTLWVRFTSESGKTSHESTFAIPTMHPYQTTVIHAGPFKMHDSSSHMLFVGMNTPVDNKISNDVKIMNESPSTAVDSFRVFNHQTIVRLIVGFVLSLGGIGIMATYFAILAIRKGRITKVTIRNDCNHARI